MNDAPIPLSTCDGNHKSLFIGINYYGQKGELRGCINDVVNIKKFLFKKFPAFKDDEAHCRILIDSKETAANRQPTRANIIAGLKWLKEGAKPSDSLFFHYSGHGGSKKDVAPDSDEADGNDETLIPLDYKEAGVIVDDELHELLVADLPKGVRITSIMDCCHSGSIFDLPYKYTIDNTIEGNVVETDLRKVAMEAAVAAGQAYFKGNKDQALKHGINAGKAIFGTLTGKGGANDDEAAKRAVLIRTTLADVIQFSGCRDDQTSADATIGGEATGACSWAFIKSLREHGDAPITYTELLKTIRGHLKEKYSQVPQLSAGHKMSMNAPFLM